MPLFVVIGRDGEGVRDRRAAVRETHLANLRPLSDAGRARFAGPLRDESGQACGSVLVLEFPSLSEARAFAESDPYVTEGIFQTLEVFETLQVFPEGSDA